MASKSSEKVLSNVDTLQIIVDFALEGEIGPHNFSNLTDLRNLSSQFAFSTDKAIQKLCTLIWPYWMPLSAEEVPTWISSRIENVSLSSALTEERMEGAKIPIRELFPSAKKLIFHEDALEPVPPAFDGLDNIEDLSLSYTDTAAVTLYNAESLLPMWTNFWKKSSLSSVVSMRLNVLNLYAPMFAASLTESFPAGTLKCLRTSLNVVFNLFGFHDLRIKHLYLEDNDAIENEVEGAEQISNWIPMPEQFARGLERLSIDVRCGSLQDLFDLTKYCSNIRRLDVKMGMVNGNEDGLLSGQELANKLLINTSRGRFPSLKVVNVSHRLDPWHRNEEGCSICRTHLPPGWTDVDVNPDPTFQEAWGLSSCDASLDTNTNLADWGISTDEDLGPLLTHGETFSGTGGIRIGTCKAEVGVVQKKFEEAGVTFNMVDREGFSGW